MWHKFKILLKKVRMLIWLMEMEGRRCILPHFSVNNCLKVKISLNLNSNVIYKLSQISRRLWRDRLTIDKKWFRSKYCWCTRIEPVACGCKRYVLRGPWAFIIESSVLFVWFWFIIWYLCHTSIGRCKKRGNLGNFARCRFERESSRLRWKSTTSLGYGVW